MPFTLRATNRGIYALTTIAILAIMLIAPLGRGAASELSITPEEQAASLLERMTPEERVGQLFLVTFQDTNVGPDSNIYNLITNHHIGGVVLLARNDNLIYPTEEGTDTAKQIQELTNQLQEDEWQYSRESQVDLLTGEVYYPAYIPLFIGIPQEGDGYPYDQILHSLTPLSNAMALGATWAPELAAQTGEILGKELSILGINMLLAPSLDVLVAPQVETTDNMGTRTFGGDPYWVGEMGHAYVEGVHLGGDGRVAVIAKHFPGHGSSDRLPEEEVSTVRKSLDELKSFDLAPFFQVTGNAESPEGTIDGILVSHIRYQGLQGNIRATTRPISLDPQALNLLLDLPELANWRMNGGVMISDDLGSLAMRRFYNLTSQTFDARRVTLNAFLAGNDLLYSADFSSEETPDEFEVIVRTLDFFAQKYREDAAFAQRVDESVLRILNLKFKLFQNFTLSTMLASQDELTELDQSSQVPFEVARQSVTLISPTQAELDDTIPDPPNQNDRIVFVSDARNAQQCSDCEPYPILNVNAMQEAVLRLYGPQASGQVRSFLLSSYPLADVQLLLEADPEEETENENLLEQDLKRANWIVFLMLSNSEEFPSFQTLRQFLSERPDLFQQKRLIVYVLGAPYYLDATNISKLTAYYSLYSKTPQFVDVAAYLLFRELIPNGASPVSISGVSYDLNDALFPDPDQIISLQLDLPEPEFEIETEGTPEPTPPPEFRVGEVIPIRTGIILDYNGNLVPDGTPVNFIFSMVPDTNSAHQVATTVDGVARTTFSIPSPGSLEIWAESETARSETIKLDIPSPSGEEAATISATTIPTFSPTTTITEITPPPLQTPTPVPPRTHTIFDDWLAAALLSSGIALGAYLIASLFGQFRWGTRAGFLAIIGGMLAYSYLALGMPGSQELLDTSVFRSVVLFTVAGAILGLAFAFSWSLLARFIHNQSIGSR